MEYLRRVNLDDMWASATATVKNDLGNMKKNIENMEALGLSVRLPLIEPWPVEDDVGFSQALAEIKASQVKGKYHQHYEQYKTIRKMQWAVTNLHQATVRAASSHAALIGVKEGRFQLTECNTYI